MKEYETVILENLQKGKAVLEKALVEKNALEVFQMFKFDRAYYEEKYQGIQIVHFDELNLGEMKG